MFRSPKRAFNRVAFDLDDTLAYGVWPDPKIGEPIELGKQALLWYHDQGFEVIIFTSRPVSHIPRIWRWLEAQGLAKAVYDVICGKPHYDLLIDDRATSFPEGVTSGS